MEFFFNVLLNEIEYKIIVFFYLIFPFGRFIVSYKYYTIDYIHKE